MSAALTVVVLALLWGLVLLRLPTVFRDGKQRALWATYLCLALVKVTALHSGQAMLMRLSGTAQILPHLLSIACAFFLLRFISLITDYYATRPRASAYQLAASLSVMLLLIMLFAVSPDGIRIDGPDSLAAATLPASVVAYWAVLNAYLGGILIAATALFWRTSREAPAGALRTGLRCIAVGLLLNAVFALQRIVFVVAHALGATLSTSASDPVFDALRAAGVILALAGGVVPATGWVRSIIRASRSLHALRPLWQKMREAFPDVILFSTRRAVIERLGVDDVHLRLYRRVIEIRDGMLALRDHLPEAAAADAAVYVEARGSVGHQRAALVEACCIELALYRRRSAQPVLDGDSRWAQVGADLADEVRWMREVSSCLRLEEPAQFVAWWTQQHHGGRADSTMDDEQRIEPVARS